jgi:hypothetical protein
MDHFQGKSVVEHLREARTKGAMAAAEIHGTEMPGWIASAGDASKETALALLILWVILSHFLSPASSLSFALLFSAGWILWKTGRSALLGWSRIERLHRVIEEERWEIEHHRTQERQELTEMYAAKGLGGKLLEEVIDVLMADDNRLLRVMLEEELGLTLEVYEHPLTQAAGALGGTLSSSALCLFGLWAAPSFGLPLAAALVLILSSTLISKREGSRRTPAIVWNLAIAGTVAGCVYFLTKMIL